MNRALDLIGDLICAAYIWLIETWGESIDKQVCRFSRDTGEEET